MRQQLYALVSQLPVEDLAPLPKIAADTYFKVSLAAFCGISTMYAAIVCWPLFSTSAFVCRGMSRPRLGATE